MNYSAEWLDCSERCCATGPYTRHLSLSVDANHFGSRGAGNPARREQTHHDKGLSLPPPMRTETAD